MRKVPTDSTTVKSEKMTQYVSHSGAASCLFDSRAFFRLFCFFPEREEGERQRGVVSE